MTPRPRACVHIRGLQDHTWPRPSTPYLILIPVFHVGLTWHPRYDEPPVSTLATTSDHSRRAPVSSLTASHNHFPDYVDASDTPQEAIANKDPSDARARRMDYYSCSVEWFLLCDCQ